MKETEENTNKRRYSMLTVGRINVIKMSILHIVIYKVYVICFKISKAFFTEIEKKNLKFGLDGKSQSTAGNGERLLEPT